VQDRTPTRSSCVASLRRSAWPARSPRPCRCSGSCTRTAGRRRSRTWTASGSCTWTWSSATGCQSIVQRLKFRPKYIVDFFRIAYLALKCVSQKYALILAQLLEFLNGKALHGRSHRTDLPGVCVDSLVVKRSQAQRGGCYELSYSGTRIAEIGRSGCATICSSTDWKFRSRRSIAVASKRCDR
jgi:hypothetical protein